tara:strand:+ start:504 stop:719 length:216 start_codon:yes stop_codon:yes gene_type:complete
MILALELRGGRLTNKIDSVFLQDIDRNKAEQQSSAVGHPRVGLCDTFEIGSPSGPTIATIQCRVACIAAFP